jgi:hypothetical protein
MSLIGGLTSLVGSTAGNIPSTIATFGIGAAADAINQAITVIPHGSIGTIDIQATLEETHTSQVQLTDHPVESGADITDHSYSRPLEVVLHCGWSDSGGQQLLNAIVETIATGSSDSYSATIFSRLTALQAARQPVTIVTTLKQYTNMVVTAIRTERNQKTSQSLISTITCRQVLFTSTQSTTLAPQANMANPADTSELQNAGPQALQSPPTAQPLKWLPGAPQ